MAQKKHSPDEIVAKLRQVDTVLRSRWFSFSRSFNRFA